MILITQSRRQWQFRLATGLCAGFSGSTAVCQPRPSIGLIRERQGPLTSLPPSTYQFHQVNQDTLAGRDGVGSREHLDRAELQGNLAGVDGLDRVASQVSQVKAVGRLLADGAGNQAFQGSRAGLVGADSLASQGTQVGQVRVARQGSLDFLGNLGTRATLAGVGNLEHLDRVDCQGKAGLAERQVRAGLLDNLDGAVGVDSLDGVHFLDGRDRVEHLDRVELQDNLAGAGGLDNRGRVGSLERLGRVARLDNLGLRDGAVGRA